MKRLLVTALRLKTVARLFSVESSESIETIRARLLYQSKKRGILENDIILGDFATENLVFILYHLQLINGSHMEWDLFYYLSGKKVPPTSVTDSKAYTLLKSFVDSRRIPQ